MSDALTENEQAAMERALGNRPEGQLVAADWERLAWAFRAGLRYRDGEPSEADVEIAARAMWNRRNEERRGWGEWGEAANRETQDAYRIMALAALTAARKARGLRGKA